MKKLIPTLFTLFLFSFSAYCQNDSEFKISDTLNTKIVNKSETFENCIEWISLNFKSPDKVIQYQNKERGKIIIKGLLADNFRTEFTLSISITENEFIYSFSNIKSLEFNYDYLKIDCYTKPCRVNYKKWNESVNNNFSQLIKKLNLSVK
jgi:hypothetical protein